MTNNKRLLISFTALLIASAFSANSAWASKGPTAAQQEEELREQNAAALARQNQNQPAEAPPQETPPGPPDPPPEGPPKFPFPPVGGEGPPR